MNDVTAERRLWSRILGFNLLTGIVLGVAGFYVGWWLGHQIHAPSIDYFADTNQNDVALLLDFIRDLARYVFGGERSRRPRVDHGEDDRQREDGHGAPRERLVEGRERDRDGAK